MAGHSKRLCGPFVAHGPRLGQACSTALKSCTVHSKSTSIFVNSKCLFFQWIAPASAEWFEPRGWNCSNVTLPFGGSQIFQNTTSPRRKNDAQNRTSHRYHLQQWFPTFCTPSPPSKFSLYLVPLSKKSTTLDLYVSHKKCMGSHKFISFVLFVLNIAIPLVYFYRLNIPS